MSRRHVVPTPDLLSRGFRPIFGESPVLGGGGGGGGVAPGSSKAAAVSNGSNSSGADDKPPPCVVGISTASVDIVSSRGASIGTEAEMDDLADLIEKVANEGGVGEVKGDQANKKSKRRRRRLVAPEIVFPGAFVAIRFRLGNAKQLHTSGTESERGEGKGVVPLVEVRFDARSALAEWAEAHGPLPATPEVATVSDDASTCSTTSVGVDSPEGNRGVAIMRSVDAQLWSDKGRGPAPTSASASGSPPSADKTKAGGHSQLTVRRKAGGMVPTSNAPNAAMKKHDMSDISIASSTHSTSSSANDFRYDWTYSTPYGGTVCRHNIKSVAADGPKLLMGRDLWTRVSASGIDLSLLSDRTQPILFYDDINLYEDDLHDNGVSHLNVKVRVMPKCLFVLYRLFVRVDYVMIRVRDVRIYHHFGSKEIFRDITWRKCQWDSLVGAGLPDDVGRWRVEDAMGEAAASIQALLRRLPEQALPADIFAHSKLELFEISIKEGQQ